MNIFRCGSCGSLNRIPESHPAGAARCGRCKGALDVTGAPQDVDEAALDAAIRSSPVPVVVDLWAPWCGPCRTAGPILDQIARSQKGRILVLKVNVDQNPGVSPRFGVQGIPTFLRFADGQLAGRQVGLPPRPELERWAVGT
jgi:thioredoxin 2